jgi:hypothetical protein
VEPYAQNKGDAKQGRRDEMLQFGDPQRDVYGPDTLKVMGAAFDDAWQSLPPYLKDRERARRKLALLILRRMRRGESDAEHLSTLALLDFLKATQQQATSCTPWQIALTS